MFVSDLTEKIVHVGHGMQQVLELIAQGEGTHTVHTGMHVSLFATTHINTHRESEGIVILVCAAGG